MSPDSDQNNLPPLSDDGLCGSIPINSTAAIPAISMTSFGSPNPASSMTLNFCGSSPCFSAAPWIGTSARTNPSRVGGGRNSGVPPKHVVCYATTLDFSAELRGQSLQVFISRDCISGVFTVALASQQMPADKGSQMFFRQRYLSHNGLR
jgi:hypothetical protein